MIVRTHNLAFTSIQVWHGDVLSRFICDMVLQTKLVMIVCAIVDSAAVKWICKHPHANLPGHTCNQRQRSRRQSVVDQFALQLIINNNQQITNKIINKCIW